MKKGQQEGDGVGMARSHEKTEKKNGG